MNFWLIYFETIWLKKYVKIEFEITYLTKLTNQWQPVDFNLSHEPIQVLLHGESMKLYYNKTTFSFVQDSPLFSLCLTI